MKQKEDSIRNFLPEMTPEMVRDEILSGLQAPRKFISSKYFYDETGSRLFEEITRLEEYYTTRTETAILKSASRQLAKTIRGRTIVELGSGSCSKISILLEAIEPDLLPEITYVPVDVSPSAMDGAVKCLAGKFPGLTIEPVVCDFLHQFQLIPSKEDAIICFFGSTIGNLTREDARSFLKEIRASMKRGDRFLLGLDMVKEKKVLELAYNDPKGITAQFNKNILRVVNTLARTNFDPDAFEHQAFFNEEVLRIEMHLEATSDQLVRSPYLRDDIRIPAGETIHTENSHKFTSDQISEMAAAAGLTISTVFNDPDRLFSLVMLTS